MEDASGMGIYMGELVGKDPAGPSFPFYAPNGPGGLKIISQDDDHAIRGLVQRIALNYIRAYGPKNVQLHVFDFSLKNPFKELSILKDIGIYFSYTASNAVAGYEALEDLARYRHHELLSSYPTLHEFNKHSKFQEKIQILLLNIEHMAQYFAGKKDFAEFVHAAQDAGIYIVAYGQQDELIELTRSERKEVVTLVQAFLSSSNGLLWEGGNIELIAHDDRAKQLNGLMERFLLGICLDESDSLKFVAEELKQDFLTDQEGGKEDFLSIPVGLSPDGRREIEFSLGDKSGVYHAFVAGTNGTGKTTLINNIILGVAQNFTAKEIKLYLMDYKQGVEFKSFENHPNCEKLFLDNANLEAARNLINDFANLIDERGNQFQRAGVSSLSDYNAVNPKAPLPRSLLIIDEVQRLFEGGWKEQSHFEKQLAYVVRQGRAFGIHIIMSTQALTGSNINNEIMSQIPLRIAFKLVGTEVWKIFASNNDAPIKLEQFQFIYNNNAGERSANVIARSNPPQDIQAIISAVRRARAEEDMTVVEVYQPGEGPIRAKAQPVERPSHDVNREAEVEIADFRSIDLGAYKGLYSDLRQSDDDTQSLEKSDAE